MNTESLLSERKGTHGDFSENARIAQHLKDFYRSCPGWQHLSGRQREAFDLDALKRSRILSGQPDFDDHWADIEGYARLGRPPVRRSMPLEQNGLCTCKPARPATTERERNKQP